MVLSLKNPHAEMRAAIVTGGAGRGIGAAVSKRLLQDGWHVLIVDRDSAACRQLLDSLPVEFRSRTSALNVDVSSGDVPQICVTKALQEFGRLDGLVNNAGLGLVKPLSEIEDDAFDRLFSVDFRAVFGFCRAAIPKLRKTSGSIVNLGSVHARQSIPGYGLYAACKAAVEALTRGIALDYGSSGVRANCVHPGFVPSPQNAALIAAFTSDPAQWVENYAHTKQAIPNIVEGLEVGRLVSFLLSAENRGITGQSIVIDGGTTCLLYEREPQQ